MVIRVTKHADGSFSLEGDDTPEDTVATGFALVALNKDKAEQRRIKGDASGRYKIGRRNA